ncbi:MAG: DUF285 domain-containing protein, partial [Streptococcaceae bacterium]|nr:DUF285 domain-containing protein [Streptococcaceae bacterium]
MRNVNWRSWKSGKKWLSAASALIFLMVSSSVVEAKENRTSTNGRSKISAEVTEAAHDETGVWEDGTARIIWKFEESTGTLTFTEGGFLPESSEEDDNRSWYNTDATDYGRAIEKIVFEQPVSLPAYSERLFEGLENLREIEGLGGIDSSQAKSTKGMFRDCQKLENLNDLSTWDTSNIENMSEMFQHSNIINVDALANWDVSRVDDFSEMFSSCESLKDVKGLARWNMNIARSTIAMFDNCEQLEDFSALANWNVHNIVNMGSMFSATGIRHLEALRNWNTENLESVTGIFMSCQNLEEATAIASWNTGKLDDISFM